MITLLENQLNTLHELCSLCGQCANNWLLIFCTSRCLISMTKDCNRCCYHVTKSLAKFCNIFDKIPQAFIFLVMI